MIKNKISVYFIFIAFFTVITTFTSIVQKSYSNLIGPSQKVKTDNLLKPIVPVLDSSIIQEIQNRPDSIDNQELNIISNSESTPTPAPKPSPTTTQINNDKEDVTSFVEEDQVDEE